MNFVIAITDSVDVGKSTVAEKPAEQLEKCVNRDADHIKLLFGRHSLKTGLGRRN